MEDTLSTERLAEELAHVGLRATRQRIAVLRILRQMQGHATAIDVHKRILQEQPNVSRKTVYEALSALANAGLVALVPSGSPPFRYESNMTDHYHSRCRVCGTLADVPETFNAILRGRVTLPEGFEVEHVQLTFDGICARCRVNI